MVGFQKKIENAFIDIIPSLDGKSKKKSFVEPEYFFRHIHVLCLPEKNICDAIISAMKIRILLQNLQISVNELVEAHE